MRRVWMGLTVVTLLLAGCGGGGSSAKSSGGTPQGVSLTGQVNNHGTKTASNGLEVEQDDFYFQPTFIKSTAGQKFTVELKNDGTVPHTFTSSVLGVDVTMNPGQKMDVSVTAPSSGFSEFHCRFHQAQGMQGAVFVGT